MKRSYMRKTTSVLFGIILTNVFWISISNAASFQGLGDLPSGEFGSAPYAVSSDGSIVVGWSRNGSELGYEAFRWSNDSGMVGLGALPGEKFYSQAEGISADSSVVVGYSNSALGGEAFRWTEDEGMQGLGYLSGGFRSTAVDASADGYVVVGWSTGSNREEAYRWTEPDGMVGLGFLWGGQNDSIAEAVSDDGSVIVGWGSSQLGTEAFRWTEDEGMQGLGYFDEAYSSYARDVSADGLVVAGYCWMNASGNNVKAFRWTEIEGMQQLGEGHAYTVSDDGSIIAGCVMPDSGEACMWDTDNNMRYIKDMLENDYDLELTNWRLDMVSGISSDGLTFVGRGINPDGYQEAWIATIPEPCTLSLLALGGLAILSKRKR